MLFHRTDPAFVERFLRESRFAASLSHPNIVTIHDYFENEGIPYIAMEYLERVSLRPLVRQLTLAQIIGVLEGLLAGLAHAESHGIAHQPRQGVAFDRADGAAVAAAFAAQRPHHKGIVGQRPQ